MRLLFVSTRQAKPSFRFRIEQMLPFYESRGHECEIVFLPSSLWARFALYRRMREFDAVVLQKRLLSRPELFALRHNARRLVYDFDDAVMFDGQGQPSGKRYNRFRAMVRSANLTICGNEYLAAQARHFTDRLTTIPTPIDTNRFRSLGGQALNSNLASSNKQIPTRGFRSTRDRPANPAVNIGWTGSRSTNRYLNAIFPVLAQLGADVSLKIISDVTSDFEFDQLGAVPVTFIPWSREVEITETAKFDIGVMPLPNDPWTRGKCGFKLLQYMALGIPAICSPVGVNRTIIAHGKTGYLAESPQNWLDQFSLLIADASRRNQIGRAARKFVEESYSLNVLGPQFVDAVLSPLQETSLSNASNRSRSSRRSEQINLRKTA